MKFSLYDIDLMIQEAIEAIHDEAEKNQGVYSDSWEDILNNLNVDREKKLLDCARYIKTVEAMAEAVKKEKILLAERQFCLEKKADKIKEFIAKSMIHGNDCEIKDANTRLSFRKSECVEIFSEKDLPSQFVECKIVPMKLDIKTAIKAGKDVPGARIIENRSLQIK
jgi:hypothetical protein